LSVAPDGRLMNPEEILAAMAEAYATCGSYRDCGRVIIRFLDMGGGVTRTDVRSFRSAFLRPGRFRFEYGFESGHRHIVGSNGEATRTWEEVPPGSEQSELVASALARVEELSGVSARSVLALLLPGRVRGRRLTELVEVASEGDERLDGVNCYRLRGRFVPLPVDPAAEEEQRQLFMRMTGRPPERAMVRPRTLWIERETFLLRRVEEHTEFESFQTDRVTTYEPEIGILISEDELRFDPPEA
jgi:hypothetical protein